jgi:hypothetical protein
MMAVYKCKDKKVPRIIVTCDCIGECSDIHIVKSTETVEGKLGPEEQSEFYLSFQPKANFRFSFWHRLKHAWRVLKTGGLYEDNIILEPSTILDLTEWLTENNRREFLDQSTNKEGERDFMSHSLVKEQEGQD